MSPTVKALLLALGIGTAGASAVYAAGPSVMQGWKNEVDPPTIQDHIQAAKDYLGIK